MATDGRVRIRIDVDGKQLDVASDSVKKFGKGAEESGKKATKTTASIKDMAISLGLVKVGAAAFAVLSQSMDKAISRFDTLNKFPKIMEGLGVETEIADKAINKIANNLEGTTGYLDDVALTAQRMYTSLKDMDKAADSALALQRAFDASGASADGARRGTEQYIQGLQKGKFEMEDWKTLQQTMNVGLNKIAEAFNMTEQELYQALQSGMITMDEFNDKMIELGSGTGVLVGLAKENSAGIADALSFLKTAVATGMADMLESVNNLVKEVTGSEISDHIESLRFIVTASFRAMGSAVEAAAPLFIMFGDVVGATIPIVNFLSPAILGLVAAYMALKVIQQVQGWYAGLKKSLEGMSIVTAMLTKHMHGQTIAQLASASATKADTIAMILNTKAASTSQVVLGVLTGQLSLSTAATLAKAAAVGTLNTVLTVLTGPIGWVVAGIGLLVGAGVALYKWFTRATEEGERLAKQNEELTESTNQLTDEIDNTSDAYKSNVQGIDSSAEAHKELIKQTQALHEEENKSAAQKEMLKENIEQLNQQIDGLNLAYDEEANAMNMSGDQLERRIELMAEQEKAQEGLERMLEISKQQSEVDKELEKTNELRQELNERYDENAITGREYRNTLEELSETEVELKEREQMLGEQYTETANQREEAMERSVAITTEGVGEMKVLYSELSEANQGLVDDLVQGYQDLSAAGTEMYETLSTDHEESVAEMTANMEENQRVISEWADNIAVLAERGISEGLIQELIDGGPESAGRTKELVEASDEELQKFDETFSKGGDLAIDALSTALGDEDGKIKDELSHLIEGTENTMREQVASADFKGIGEDVSAGMAQGVESGAGDAIDASGKMADDMTKKTQETLQTHSPSRVYMRIGEDVTDGLSLGIKGGTSKVMQAIENMFNQMQQNTTRSFNNITSDIDQAVSDIERSLMKLLPVTTKSMSFMLRRLKSGTNANVRNMQDGSRRMVSAYDGLNNRMSYVGFSAMAGLRRGLINGRGSVMRTAASIANSVASTMQRALRIHSPSKVMEKDVGRWIPEGLAEGIRKNIGVVDDVISDMSSSVFNVGTPELALGGSNIGRFGQTMNRVTNTNSSKTVTNNSSPVVNIGTVNNNQDGDIEEVMKQAAWILSREKERLDG